MIFHIFLPNLVAATAFISDKKGHVLLVKRGNTSKLFKLFWQLPEGKIKPFENPKHALLREMEEEVGFKTKQARFLFKEVYIKKYFDIFPYLKITRHVFKLDNPKQIKLSHEHEDYKYLNLNEDFSSTPLLPGTRELLSRLNKMC